VRASVTALAEALGDAIGAQDRLLALVLAQRAAVVSRRHDEVDRIARDIETEVRRLAVTEMAREAAAVMLADELGLAATRWSALAGALLPAERAALEPRVQRLESLVRDLELANAINGQLVRQELAVVDASIRGLGADGVTGPRLGAYTQRGGRAVAPGAPPMLLNTSA
jgi:flagellar biosynthesis/type III secretory pathway chaperone